MVMKIQHLRNATALLTLGPHRLLLDPMLAEAGALPGFKMLGGGRRPNPLVALPEQARAALDSATGVLITHEHPDHLDRAGVRWIRDRALPVWASAMDAPNLRKKGLQVQVLQNGGLGMQVQEIPAQHGRGGLAWMMGPVTGYYLDHPDEPSVFVTSDAVLTATLLAHVQRLQPDVILAPAGAANMGLGGDILFSVDELVQLTHASSAQMVFNHLEALDHCPTTRDQLRARLKEEGLLQRAHVPEDGETLSFERTAPRTRAAPELMPSRRPGVQKWLTQRFTMT